MPRDMWNEPERVWRAHCLAEWTRCVQSDRQSLTVYFDGACPLCQAEITIATRKVLAQSASWMSLDPKKRLQLI